MSKSEGLDAEVTSDVVAQSEGHGSDALSGTESMIKDLPAGEDAGQRENSSGSDVDNETARSGACRRPDGTLMPGAVINPGGSNQYTKRNALKGALSTLADDVPPESTKDRIAIWRRFIELAKAGDPWAVKEYLTRRWAPPTRRRSTS